MEADDLTKLECVVVQAILDQGDGFLDVRPAESAACFRHLEPEVFGSRTARVLYAAARMLAAQGRPWGALSVSNHLDSSGEDPNPVFAALFEQTQAHEGLASWTIRDGVDRMLRRRHRRDLWQWHEGGSEARAPELLDPPPQNGLAPFAPDPSPHAILVEHLDRILAHEAVVPTGWPTLDRWLEGGLRPGELAIVGARTGVGKTALLCQWAIHVWCRSQKRFAYFSMEMSPGEILERMAVSLGEHELRERIHGADFRVYDRVWTVEQITRAIQKDGPFDIVMVDHISLMRDPKAAKQGRVQEVSAISGDLKRLAADLVSPIVAACQLNRQPTGRDDGRPRLSDFRDSGSIEQDSTQSVLLHDPWSWWRELDDKRRAQTPEPKRQQLDLILAKNRRGQKGSIAMRFDQRRQQITEWSDLDADMERRFV